MKMSPRPLQDDLNKTSRKQVLKTSWKRFENVFKASCEDGLNTSWRRLEDVCIRRIANTSWRHLEDVLESQKCLLGRGTLWQRVQCQLSLSPPKINLVLFFVSIEECLSDIIICLELVEGVGKDTKKDVNTTFKEPILRWLLSPLPHRQTICFVVYSETKL